MNRVLSLLFFFILIVPMCLVVSAQKKQLPDYYVEGFLAHASARDEIREQGLTLGVQIVPYVGFGLGVSRFQVYNRRDNYPMFNWQLRGFMNPQKTLYYSYRQGSGKFRDPYYPNQSYSAVNRELQIGVRVNPYVIFAGGWSFWRHIYNDTQSRFTRETQGSSISGRLILTLDKTRSRTWDLGPLYGYAIWGFLASSKRSYPGFNRSDSRMEFTGHLGGGKKLSRHLGLGLGLTALGHSQIGTEASIRNMQGIGLHVAGIWERLVGMVEAGYAMNIVDGYGITNRIYRFYPGGQGDAVMYYRASVGPRFGRLTLQASYLGTPRVKGLESLLYQASNGEWIFREETNFLTFSGFQLGIGFFVD
ncbi:MAG: hypothetical protein AAFQ83_23650 [Bacteroidota bacterium]